jgi:hypothetical protein
LKIKLFLIPLSFIHLAIHSVETTTKESTKKALRNMGLKTLKLSSHGIALYGGLILIPYMMQSPHAKNNYLLLSIYSAALIYNGFCGIKKELKTKETLPTEQMHVIASTQDQDQKPIQEDQQETTANE